MMFAETILNASLLFILPVIWASAKETNLNVAAGDGPGVRAICMLDAEEHGIIQQTYNIRKPNQVFKNNYYIELFVRGKTADGIKSTTGEEVEGACNDLHVTAHDEELDRLVHKIAGGHSVQGYGFIVAPAKSTLYQHFHIDFLNTTANYWIPLVHLTSRNAPQYIPNFVHDPTDGEEMFGLEFTVMENEGLLGMIVAQTICQAFTLLYMAPGTIHRGIPNGENHDHPIFFIEMDDERRRIDDDDEGLKLKLNDNSKYFNMEDFGNHTSTMA
jgi:hypothetical protein